jgi:hypothetical protein
MRATIVIAGHKVPCHIGMNVHFTKLQSAAHSEVAAIRNMTLSTSAEVDNPDAQRDILQAFVEEEEARIER